MPRRILLFDPNHDSRDSLAMILKFFGHEITILESATDAQRVMLEIVPDFAFIRIKQQSTYKRWFEFAEWFRASDQLSQTTLVAIVLITRSHGLPLFEHGDALKAGFDFELDAPVSLDKLQILLR